MAKIILNSKAVNLDVEPDTPLLWVLRDHLDMTGTKYACGKGLCGACTVLIDNKQVRSCIIPINYCYNRQITTIEGLSEDLIHLIIDAWADAGASECGYCQPGQVMSAVALLLEKPRPSDKDIDQAMSGNLCRCGIYQRIRNAIHNLALAGLPEKIYND